MLLINIHFIFLIMIINSTEEHDTDVKTISKDNVSIQKYFANLLKSLVKLNDERLKTITRLHMLNRIDFGKSLRTDVKTVEDYDEIIKSIEAIVSLLSNKDDINHFIDGKDISKIARGGSRESNSDGDSESNESTKENDKDNNGTLRYYYTCGKPLLRCIRSCYDASWKACYVEYCEDGFVSEMLKYCREACSSRFDPYYFHPDFPPA